MRITVPSPVVGPRPLESVCLAVAAMATRFELVLPVEPGGLRPEALRAAGEAALAEILAVEECLSIYRPSSVLARVNALAAQGPVRVAPVVFGLLERARDWSQRTNQTFDPTVGALVKIWRAPILDETAHREAIAVAREAVGWSHVTLDAATSTVRFNRAGLSLDLGSLGKGWALDRAAECLRESGVTCALLHGGTSTVIALGTPPSRESWRVELGSPAAESATEAGDVDAGFPPVIVSLRDEALSVSATWGRTHRDAAGRSHGHVLDPRTGEPVRGPRRAAVAGPGAADTDVLSTALLVSGTAFLRALPAWGDSFRGWFDEAAPAEVQPGGQFSGRPASR